MPRECRRLAVVLHDIEPGTLARCALIRDWLEDVGVDRVTLCVVPAPEDHPFLCRSPALVEWLQERRRCGDAIAQHGLGPGRTPPRVRTARRDVTTMVGWRLAAGRFPVASERGAMRLDMRPDDFDRLPDRTRAMERTLRKAAAAREVVTFDDLVGGRGAAVLPASRNDALA